MSQAIQSTDRMLFASALSSVDDPIDAANEVITRVLHQLDGRPCHLAVLFVSSLYDAPLEPLLRHIRGSLGEPLVLGCTASGVLAVDTELEFMPGIALSAAYLPRVRLHPFTVSPEDLAEPRDPGFWIELLGAAPTQEPVGIVLPDPFTCDVTKLMSSINAVYPSMPLIGGLASSAEREKPPAIFLNGDRVPAGAAGVLLTGDVVMQTVVSQGCRPIGRPYIITQADGATILQLAGRPAVEVLRALLADLPETERLLAQRALFLGLAFDEQKASFHRGDFLIRNLVGFDPESGALVVGEQVRVGQTVQFQLRDAEASKEDLQHLLHNQAAALKRAPSSGALLFNCQGRGQDLYGEPHYDIRAIHAALGACPIAGFFCNGEIGPIAGRNFVHGFTSSLGVFRPRTQA